MKQDVTLVEVGMRDGFQSVTPFIPTHTKLDILKSLYRAGVRRFETTSIVSKTAVPQLADAPDIIAAANRFSDLDSQVLIPKAKHAEIALKAGAKHLSFVLSVSIEHNQGNVRQLPTESVEEYKKIVSILPEDVKLRLNIATAFDCPYKGRMPEEQTLNIMDRLLPLTTNVEVALCDTTGRVTPDHVHQLFNRAQDRYPQINNWAFHGHDTYGLGMANVYSAWKAGVKIFDASFAGLGGCPFSPGATGNVATEDVLSMFDKMGIKTGINLERFLAVSNQVADLPGAKTGGRVRLAMAATTCTS